MAYVEYEADGKTIKARVQQKTDTLANWMANDNIVLAGEQAFVVNESGMVTNFRLGDGTRRFSELPDIIQYDQGSFVAVTTNALPTPAAEVGYSQFLTEGTYTHASGGFTVPAGKIGVGVWNGSTWALTNVVDLPKTEGTDKLEYEEVPKGKAVVEYVNNNTLLIKDYIVNANLYNENEDISGYYINSTSGQLVSSVNSRVSKQISVSDVDKIIVNGRSGTTVYRFLNSSGSPMKALNQEGIQFSTYEGASNGTALYKPVGAVSFQITTVLSGVGTPESIYINESGIEDTYFDKNITGVKELEDVNSEVFVKSSLNLFNGDIIEGKYLRSASGSVSDDVNSTITDLIPVKPNTYYYLSNRKNAGSNVIVGYSSNKITKNKIKSVNGLELSSYSMPNIDGSGSSYNGPFLTSSDCYYIQVSLRFDNTVVTDYDKIMLEEIGSVYDPNFTPSPYQPYNEQIRLKESALPNIPDTSKKTIKILVVGNSFSQNSFGLVPKILSQLDSNLEFVIGIAYDGGSPLVQHYANFTNSSQVLGETTYTPISYTLYKNMNNQGWTSSSKTANQCLTDEQWDIITFQQSGGQSNLDYDIYYKPYINKLHKIVYNTLNRNIKIGWVSIHGSYGNNDSELLTKYEGTIANTLKVLNQTATSIVFPYGTAIQNARTTSLKLIGEGIAKNLMTDRAHLQAGIGELTAGYCNSLVIINEVDIKYSSLIGDKIEVLEGDGIVSSTILGMTDDNRFLSQASAINAIKNPFEITDISVIESDM